MINVNQTNQDIKQTAIPEIIAKEPLDFAIQTLKELGKALLIAVGICTLVGIPIIYYCMNRNERPKSIVIEHKPEPPPQYIHELVSLLEEYIDPIIGKTIHQREREKMNSELGTKVANILKANGVQGYFSGILHPIFREIMEVRMKKYLDEARTDQAKRNIIIAFGFPEDEIDAVLLKYENLREID